MKSVQWCCDCRNGEHSNYDNDVQLVVIKDPDTNKIIRRGYMCERHRIAYSDDGYILYQ